MELLKPLLKALFPVVFAVLAASGVELSPEIKLAVEENLTVILLAMGGLGALFPSIKAALKFKQDAK